MNPQSARSLWHAKFIEAFKPVLDSSRKYVARRPVGSLELWPSGKEYALTRLFPRPLIALIALCMLIVATVRQAPSQTVGIQPFGSYDSHPLDQVSLADLGVHIDIPLVEKPGRGQGMGLNVHLVYGGSLGGWTLNAGSGEAGGVNTVPGTYNNPEDVCRSENPAVWYTVTDGSGYTHVVGGATGTCTAQTYGGYTVTWPSVSSFADDGSGYYMYAPGGGTTNPLFVAYPNGSIYNGNVTDSNGNTAAESLGFLVSQNPSVSVPVTDDTGHSFSISGGPDEESTIPWAPMVITYTDTTGTPQTITINFTTQNITSDCHDSHGNYPTVTTEVVHNVVYSNTNQPPSNFTPTYTFTYASDGLISSMTLPTGGTITYQGTLALEGGCPNYSAPATITTLTRTAPDGATTYTRTVLQTQDGGAYPTATSTTIATPDGTQQSINFAYTIHQPYAVIQAPTSYETAHTWSKSNVTYRSTMKCYNGSTGDCTSTPVVLPITQIATTTTVDGKTSNVVETLNLQGLQTELDEYDYGTTSPLRKTKTVYKSFANDCLTASPADPLKCVISDRVDSVQVLDGSNNQLSRVSYGYDEYSLAASSASGTAGLQNITEPRGNRTSQHVWNSQTGSTLDTHWCYDVAGQVVAVEDPGASAANGQVCTGSSVTAYSHDATDTYITGTTYPTWTGNAATSTSATYDAKTGLVTSKTDANNNKTTYSYNALFQPSSVSSPDGGSTAYTYPDTNHVDVTVSQSPNPSKSTVTVLDSLGRVSQTQLTSDPSGTVYVDTTYDNMGRVSTVSNPYRTKQDQTYGLTTYSYDPLGRKTAQTQADGTSTQYWCYDNYTSGGACSANVSTANSSGSWVDFLDENNNHWQRTYDALGRMTGVMEPGASSQAPTLETDYTYDILGNLLAVAQKGTSAVTQRARSFTYDSLSRLITSANPETGTNQYTYDANSNVKSRTDARGVVTNYAYDALNRLTSKAYTNAPAGTMTSCYLYGSSTGFFNRLIAEWTQSGSCSSTPPSNPQSVRYYDAYDSMGRVLTERQCVAGFCTSTASANCTSLSSATGLQYCYDAAGNLLAYSNGLATAAVPTYPQQALLFSQNFDGAGRLATVGSSWNDTTHPTQLFGGTSYSPANALTNWNLGAHVAVTRSYAARLWVTGESAVQQ